MEVKYASLHSCSEGSDVFRGATEKEVGGSKREKYLIKDTLQLFFKCVFVDGYCCQWQLVSCASSIHFDFSLSLSQWIVRTGNGAFLNFFIFSVSITEECVASNWILSSLFLQAIANNHKWDKSIDLPTLLLTHDLVTPCQCILLPSTLLWDLWLAVWKEARKTQLV